MTRSLKLAGLPRAGTKLKPLSLETKITKMEGVPKTWVLTGKLSQKFSVEAVCVMFSVTGCHTLSTPVCESIPKISDGITSRYTFTASFDGEKPEKKTVDSTENMLNVYHDDSQIVNAMTRIREIKFQEKKINALKLAKILEHFRPI